MKIAEFLKLTMIGFLLIFYFSGCSAMPAPPKYNPEQFTMHKESNGIEISVEPFSDKNRVKKYFGTDLIARGIYPFFVKIYNKRKRSFIVSENAFALKVHSSLYDKDSSKIIVDKSTAESIQIAGAFTSPFIGLIGAKMGADAQVKNATYNQNRLKPSTVSPNEIVDGFVYFTLPNKNNIPNKWELIATIKSLSGDESVEMIFR